MSRSALAPLALTGQPQALNVPSQLRGCQLRLGNESAYTLQWTWGQQSGILYPSEIDVLKPDATSVGQIQLLPVQGILPAAMALTANLVSEIAFAPDGFSGQYPQQMSRLAQVAANKSQIRPTDSVAISGPSMNIPGTSTLTKTVSLLPGTDSLRFLGEAGGLTFAYRLLVEGQTTGTQYFGDPNSPGSPQQVTTPALPLTIPVDTEWDTLYTITIQTTTGTAIGVFISALFDVENPGQTGDSAAVSVVNTPFTALKVWDGVIDSQEPAAGTQGVCQVSATAGHRWIFRGFHAEMSAIAAPAANAVRLRLRDGGFGVGTILWSWAMGIPAVAGFVEEIGESGLAIEGTSGQAMSLEFSSGIAGVFESCGFGADLVAG